MNRSFASCNSSDEGKSASRSSKGSAADNSSDELEGSYHSALGDLNWPASHELRLEDDSSFHIAVATIVDDTLIPQAIEIPSKRKFEVTASDARNHLFEIKRFGILLCLSFASLFVFAIIWPAPTSPARSGGLLLDSAVELRVSQMQRVLIETFGEDRVLSLQLDDPYARAQAWLLYQDPMQLQVNSTNLVQRFVVAVLYFQFHREGTFAWCNAAEPGETDTVCPYGSLVDTPNAKANRLHTSRMVRKWLSGFHECTWGGISCIEEEQNSMVDPRTATSGGVINEFHFSGLGVTAPLPSKELSFFPSLEVVDFSFNDFYGTLPPEWGDLSTVKTLVLGNNNLQGTIPEDWATFSSNHTDSLAENLERLELMHNQLTGTLPVSFVTSMTNVKRFCIEMNLFSGTIPPDLFAMAKIEMISLSDNIFTGGVPSTLFGDAPIRYVALQKLNIAGTIPSEISALYDLRVLDIRNTNIGGTIPDELYKLSNLKALRMSDTFLTGTISSLIGNLSLLRDLDVADSHISGTLPVEIAGLENLETLRLNGNDMEGEISEDVCALRGPLGIHEIAADCTSSVDEYHHVPKMLCSCCDVCCDHETGICSSENGKYRH